MANRLERRLDHVAADESEPLIVIIDCPCGACEKMTWSPDMAPTFIQIGPDGRENRVYDLCPGLPYR